MRLCRSGFTRDQDSAASLAHARARRVATLALAALIGIATSTALRGQPSRATPTPWTDIDGPWLQGDFPGWRVGVGKYLANAWHFRLAHPHGYEG